ncbi:MAG: DNA/RNA non-specific endonuclease [Ferruginibacter sp.]
MKKIIILIIILLNIAPGVKNGKVTIEIGTEAKCQTLQQIIDYLNYGLNPNGSEGWFEAGQAGTNMIYFYPGNGDVEIIHVTAELMQATAAWLATQNGNPTNPPAPSGNPHHSSTDLGDEEDMEIFIDIEIDPGPDITFEDTGGGPSGTSGGPNTQFNIDQGTIITDDLFTNSQVQQVSLPCMKYFLTKFRKIIQFTDQQWAQIKYLKFDGGTLIGFIDQQGRVFDNAVDVTIINNDIIYHQSTYKFICFACLDNNPPPGLEIIHPTDLNGNTATCYKNFPNNDLNYCYEIHNDQDHIMDADPGRSFMTITVGTTANPGTLYCRELTLEDCNRGARTTRDEDYLTDPNEPDGIHIQHWINLPTDVREFLQKFFPTLPPCWLNYVNDKLAALHANVLYTSSSLTDQAKVEYTALLYYGILGGLSCTCDEPSAENQPYLDQFGKGALHELLNTLDPVQLIEAIINIGKGLAAPQKIVAFLDALTGSARLATIDPNPHYDENNFLSSLMTSNNPNSSSYSDKVKRIIQHFMEMYFTQCDNYLFPDGTYGTICGYRHGELFMMAFPIIMSGGDWAFIKADQLIGNYVNYSEEAIRILKTADIDELGATVVQSGTQALIKDGPEIDALVLTTEEKTVTEILVTGEQDLPSIIDPGDLNNVLTQEANVGSVFTVAPGNSTSGWSKTLNRPQPNTTYNVNNFSYHLDGTGNLDHAFCSNLTLGQGPYNKYQQTYKCRRIKDGLPGDDGGHIFGRQFNGIGEQVNYVPMNSVLNQSGGWHQMEMGWRNKLLNGGTVTDVHIDIIYGTNKRPIQFNVTAIEDGIPAQYSFSQ